VRFGSPDICVFSSNIIYVAPIDNVDFARSVREDTAELASYVLADKKDKRNASFLTHRPSASSQFGHDLPTIPQDPFLNDDPQYTNTAGIEEVSEPPSPNSETDSAEGSGPSMLTSMFRRSPPESLQVSASTTNGTNDATLQNPSMVGNISLHTEPASPTHGESESTNEITPLLGPKAHRSHKSYRSHRCRSPDDLEDLENQKPQGKAMYIGSLFKEGARTKIRGLAIAMNPKSWNKEAIWENGVMDPIRCLPAVVVGLLLNILDALSYGEWLP
jgi:SulP family sulfate permease